MRFSGRILGNKALAKALDRISEGYEAQYRENLGKAAALVESEAKKSIQKSSAGESQTRYNPKRRVKVSKPGDAPNLDSGTLFQSIGFNVDENRLVAEVGTSLKYGKHLEFGTQNMAARPWLFPALEKSKGAFKAIFTSKPKHKKKVG